MAGMVLFSLNLVGGGDAKLLAAAGLWIGYDQLVPFLLYVTIFGGALALLLLAYRRFPAGALPLPAWAARLHAAGGRHALRYRHRRRSARCLPADQLADATDGLACGSNIGGAKGQSATAINVALTFVVQCRLTTKIDAPGTPGTGSIGCEAGATDRHHDCGRSWSPRLHSHALDRQRPLGSHPNCRPRQRNRGSRCTP